jgi:16S rRNA (guanine527-N7)-methyltransferase
VERWADRLDLTSRGDLAGFAERHVADALRLLPLLHSLPQGPALDLGSGAGVPGIPLAIASPDRPWRLLERRRGRAAFLEEAVRSLELSAEVVVADASAARRRPDLARAHVFAVARAVAPPAEALSLLLPFVAEQGIAAVFMGASGRLPEKASLWAEGIAIVRPEAGHEGREYLESPGNL